MASRRAERSDYFDFGSDDAENIGKTLAERFDYFDLGSDDAENIGKTSNFLVVAAIDFGTTYSGYAYSLKSANEKNHLKVITNEQWSAAGEMLSMKAPTTVLFDRNGIFHSFGFKAESQYAKLADEEQHDGWQYFRRFKLKLYNRKITKTMNLKDDQGRSKLALVVFSSTIEYLKKHLMERLERRIPNIRKENVLWVLTVPAIWDDGAKQFMEEAAKQAGILEGQFILALEPECAAIYCKELEVQKEKETNEKGNLKSFESGAQFMVVDLGEPTVSAKSCLVIDVMPWNCETDIRELENYVRTIEMDGLVWGQAKLIPVGNGMKKLQINAVIEDDKVSTDDLEDKITAFEDFILFVRGTIRATNAKEHLDHFYREGVMFLNHIITGE